MINYPLIDIPIIYFLLPVITGLTALYLTRLSIPILRRFKIVAVLGERHVHNGIIPTMGGIAMIIAMIIAMTILYFYVNFVLSGICLKVKCLYDHSFFKILLPLTILIPTGIIDDMRGMRARYKLLLQVLTGILCWWGGIRLDSILFLSLPESLSLIVTTCWIVGFVNAFNLIDGLDGLAAGISIVSAVCLAVVMLFNNIYCCALIMLCLGASCLGFLKYNFYPAKIFMGDTGSMFLGYMFAVITIISSTKNAFVSMFAVSILACGIPLIDAFLACWRRIALRFLSERSERRGIMTADRDHLHHRFLDYYQSQSKTTVVFYVIALILGIGSVSISIFHKFVPGVTLAVMLITFYIVLKKFAIIEIWYSTRLMVKRFRSPRKIIILNMLIPLSDLLIVVFAIYIGMYLVGANPENGRNFVFFVMPVIVILSLSHTYKTFWFRTEISDYIYLIRNIAISYIVVYGINCFLSDLDNKLLFRLCTVTGLVAGAGIVGQRCILNWLLFTLIKHVYNSKLHKKSVKTLIYGGGINAAWFIKYQYSTIHETPLKIVGILDDEPTLKGAFVYGVPVLGGLIDLENVYRKTPFEKIVLTTELNDPVKRKLLEDFSQKNAILLTKVKHSEKDFLQLQLKVHE